MRVILLEKIINFGSFGDIVKVRPGYARNYLLPRGKALLASGANLKYFEERKLHLQEISQEEEQRALARAEKFSTAKLPIRAQADADGRLFGSVGVREILVASDLAWTGNNPARNHHARRQSYSHRWRTPSQTETASRCRGRNLRRSDCSRSVKRLIARHRLDGERG